MSDEIFSYHGGESAHLTIDLSAVVENYKYYDKQSKGQSAAVVKANAYGLGMEEVSMSLLKAGCQHFFVAEPAEAMRLREISDNAEIFVFNGFPPQYGEALAKARLTPCLNNKTQIEEWIALCQKTGVAHPACLHIDTGFHRLGISMEEYKSLKEAGLLESLPLRLIMSHFACADTPENKLNEKQFLRFEAIRKDFPDTPASLANSAATLTDSKYHFELTRIGIGLYGAAPYADGSKAHKIAAKLHARIIRTRAVKKGESIGYGASYIAPKDMRIGVIALGYGDGILRCIGKAKPPYAKVFCKGVYLPLIARVSMDLMTIDMSDNNAGMIEENDWVEVLGTHSTLEENAKLANTINYELLTSLGNRYKRYYKKG